MTEAYDMLVRDNTELRQRAEKAEADAAMLKEAFQVIGTECIRLSEQSAPPASEAEDVREQTCRHWGTWRTVGDCMADGDCHEGCPQAQHLEQAPDPAPADTQRMWQHEETGRVTETDECPGPRWFEIPNQPTSSEAMARIDESTDYRAWRNAPVGYIGDLPINALVQAIEGYRQSSQTVPPVPDPSEAEAEPRRLVEWAMMVMPNYTRHHEAVRESSERIRRALASAQPAVPEDSGVFLCAKCGYGSEEHGMSGHPANECAADMRLYPSAPYRAAPTKPAVGDQT